MPVVEDVVTPTGPYRLRLMGRSGTWCGALPGGREARAWQHPDGRVVVRAPDEPSLATARFMLALDDDTTEFHPRFARDPLLGAAARALVGYRPLRLATVTHAVLRALCGQLIEARRARAIERSILRLRRSRRLARGASAALPRRPPPQRARPASCDGPRAARPHARPRAAARRHDTVVVRLLRRARGSARGRSA